MNSSSTIRKVVPTLLLVAVVALSWSRLLDDEALQVTTDSFTRTLAVAALARAFNGVISVAQGTEVAIQPIGVGVTLTLGEILDPINDLVERFSLLALLASVSLGLQLALGEIFSTSAFSVLLTLTCILSAALIWTPRSRPWMQTAQKILIGIIVMRFLFVFVLLTSHWVDAQFLAAKHEQAVTQLQQTSSRLQELEQAEQTATDVSPGFVESFKGMLDSSRRVLDVESQLADLKHNVEESAREIINLIVIFTLQTVIVPLAALFILWGALRAYLSTFRGRPQQ